MWVKFIVNGQLYSEANVAYDREAIEAAEEIAAREGSVEIWTPKLVIVKATKYDCLDYGKYRQDKENGANNG